MPKGEVTTVPKCEEMQAHEGKLSSNNTPPESSVIRTIGECQFYSATPREVIVTVLAAKYNNNCRFLARRELFA